MGLLSYLRGDDILNSSNGNGESRTLTAGKVPAAMLGSGFRPLYTDPPAERYQDVGPESALRVHEAWSCVRALADAASALPLKVYRRQPDGSRAPAGDETTAVRLLRRPR